VSEVEASELQRAIERQHGGRATFARSVLIDERQDGKPVWQGVVHVFDLQGHPTATRAYAWSSPIEGSAKRRFYAVLHLPPIESAVDAVRAGSWRTTGAGELSLSPL
jgi:hypothetical protein